MLRTLVVLSLLFAVAVVPSSAQQVRVSGTVATVDSAAKTLVMKMDAGPELTVRLSRANATLQPGQHILVNGRISQDEKAVDAVDILTACPGKSDMPLHAALQRGALTRGCRVQTPLDALSEGPSS